jgi:hypothetical protein
MIDRRGQKVADQDNKDQNNESCKLGDEEDSVIGMNSAYAKADKDIAIKF